MNNDILAGKWKQLSGKIRERWGNLTNDELDQIAGVRDQLVGKIQEKYGYAREEAERQLDEFLEEAEIKGW
ncbi:CsbD family protein [Chloroflexota bacterium]